MDYLDSAEDIFRDIDAIKTRQKYQEALEVQTQRNKSDDFKIRNYDFVVAERDALLNERKNGAEMAIGIVDFIFKDLKKNGFDSDSEGTAKYPTWIYTLKRLAGEQLQAMANELYKKEFKVELENKFKQEYQKHADQIIETARTKSSGTQEVMERAVKNLGQKIWEAYPSDVFKSLQTSWRIWCDDCRGSHVYDLTANDVTAILRYSSVKKDAINRLTYFPGLGTPFPAVKAHFPVLHLAYLVRGYITSRLGERQEKG